MSFYYRLPVVEKCLKKCLVLIFVYYKRSELTLKFGDVVVNKKEFHASKQAIGLSLVDADKIVLSDKFKCSDNGSKYFIGYLGDNNVIKPLCIILPQMSGCIRYFVDGGKNMSSKTEDESVYQKYNEIWDKVKKALNTRSHNQPVYDGKYIKAKVRTFDGVISILFSDNKIPKEGNHYICIAAICVDSVLKKDKKNYPQVYLEQRNYRIKKRKMVDFIDAEVDLSSDSLDD